MGIQNKVRIFVKIIAFGTFLFQMQNSLRHYLDKPVVQQKSTIKYSDVKKPVLYICQVGQFNYTKAKEVGYQDLTMFASGQLGYFSGIYSWKGNQGNLTFNNLQKLLFSYDYSNLWVVETLENDTSVYRELDMFYLTAYGFCMKSQILGNYFLFTTEQKLSFFLIDPHTENNLMINVDDNAKGIVGSDANGLFDYYTYDLEIVMYDSRIHEYDTCIDYNEKGSSYSECVENSLKDKLLEWYGCLPPWFPSNTSLTCEQKRPMKIGNKNYMTIAYNELYRLASNQNLRLFSSCLKPCTRMDFNLKEVHRTKTHDYSGIDVNIDVEKIVKYTDLIAYNEFNLIVDFGSALGLWLGLSALSIFDSLAEIMFTIYNKFRNVTSKHKRNLL